MKTNIFTNTKKAAMYYGIILEDLKKEGHEYGLALNKEPYLIEHDGYDYTVHPVDFNESLDVTTGSMYVVVDIKKDGVDVAPDAPIDLDLLSAICMLTGVMNVKVGEVLWEWKPNTKSFVGTLAKYVGITVAITIVAGLSYCAYKKYVSKE